MHDAVSLRSGGYEDGDQPEIVHVVYRKCVVAVMYDPSCRGVFSVAVAERVL